MVIGTIFYINVKAETAGERGIPKTQVDSVYVSSNGLQGDFNRYRTEKKQGNPDTAVMLLPLETLIALHREGWPVNPGDLGENFTTQGILYDSFSPGKKYEIISSDMQIEITEPCTPCANLPYVGEEKIKEFMKTLLGRRGWYAKVLHPGAVRRFDAIFEK